MIANVNEIIKRTWSGARRRRGPLFLHDNARPHTAGRVKEKLQHLRWEVIDHPPYSPDASPSDYHLFLSLQNHLNGKMFENSEGVIQATEAFFSSKSPEFYREGIYKLFDVWQQIVNCKGAYAN